MAIIQLPISEGDLKALLELTGEKAGSKAVQHTIDGYKKLTVQLKHLREQHHTLLEEHGELKDKVSQFSGLLSYFNATEH